jgi:invasion protein IalB
MTDWTAPAAAMPPSRMVAAAIAHRTAGKGAALGVALALAVAPQVFAQQAPAAPEHQETAPAKSDAAAGAVPDGHAQPGPLAQLSFSPWTKFCFKGIPGEPVSPDAKEVCFTGTDAHLAAAGGQRVAVAMLLEPADGGKKLLRITFPLGMKLSDGTRIILDQDGPVTAPYRVCVAGGCMADYEASPELIAKLKTNEGLRVEAISDAGVPISVLLPLADFAKAYDGPPADPANESGQKSPQKR